MSARLKERGAGGIGTGISGGRYAETRRPPNSEADLGGGAQYSDIKDQKERLAAIKQDMAATIQRIVDSGTLTDWMERYAASQQHSRANGMSRWSPYNRLLADVQAQQRRIYLSDAELAGLPPGTFAMSANAWRKHGRHIRKGEKAIWILQPRRVPVTVDDPDVPGKTRREFKVVGFAPQAEFDACQTDGDPFPDEWVNPPVPYLGSGADAEPDPNAIPHMELVAGDLGYTVSYARNPGRAGVLGFASPSTKEIVIAADLPAAQRASTLAHELAHVVCGHVNDPGEYATHRGRMETEAELAAYMVCAEMGLPRADSDSFSANYIASWSRQDPEAVERAFAKSSAAVGKIMREWEPTPGWPPAG